MINSFDSEVAIDVGINAAIIYKNIQYWCEYNRTNRQNEFDGYYWTFNSVSAFAEQFPYLSTKQIRTALQVLEDKGYIIAGNFNKSPYDRTKWYADLKVKRSDCNFPSSQIDLPYRANENASEGKPIPYINTNINTNNNSRKKDTKKETFEDVMNSYPVFMNNAQLKAAMYDFIEMRKNIKKPLATNRALKININSVIKLSGGDPEKMIQIIEQSIAHGWQGFYELKDGNTNIADNFFTDLLNELEAENGNINFIEGIESNAGQISELL